MTLKRYTSVKEALWALEAGKLVDELENQLSPQTLAALKRRALMDSFTWAERFAAEYVKPKLAYRIVDGKEIAWFGPGGSL